MVTQGLHFDYIGVSTNHAKVGEERDENIANLKKWIDASTQAAHPHPTTTT